jgi:CMP-N,N'-diacetyllegionaminic acid synthase
LSFFSIILARGGSKGIPDKNIIELKGKPLISYSINASQDSKCNETWVSTDCNKIKNVAKSLGANVLDRPKEYATDTSTSEEALLHFCRNIICEYVIFIQPTSPLLHYNDINKGIELIQKNICDSVISCYEEEWTGKWTYEPALASLQPTFRPSNYSLGDASNNFSPTRTRRQDVEYPTYIENGAFYISKREDILNSKNRFHGKVDKVVMPFFRSFQIDTFEDLAFIEKII